MTERPPEQQIREAVSELCELALVPNIREELRREILAALVRLVAERDEALRREAALREALERATYIARNLLGMIDRETWRAQGGDDLQGHYEGDYYAERVENEIRELAALAAAAGRTPGEETWDCGCPFGGPHDENCALAEAGRAE